MSEKTYIYEYDQKELDELSDIELKALKKASRLMTGRNTLTF